MIGFFPDPLPDELLYSACARVVARAGYRSKESTGYDLFGGPRVIVAIDLPCNLDALLSNFPPGHQHTADGFIDANTMLPLYSPFVPPDRVSVLREDMRGDKGGAVHGRLGILTSGISVDFYRYCPACVEADRGLFGETYWHRLHQAPGVVVCPVHNVFLEQSDLYTRTRPNRETFVTAEEVVRTVSGRPINEIYHAHRAYKRIAEDVDWLMKQSGLIGNHATYRNRYFSLLRDAGFSQSFTALKVRKIIQAVTDYYSHEFLETLGCEVQGKKYTWIHRLIHNHGRAKHPLQHLLLMQFLGYSPAQFFRLETESKDLNSPRENQKPASEGTTITDEKRDKHRRKWLKVQESNPELGRAALGAKASYLRGWLGKNDKEWFEQNSPAPLKSRGPGVRKDWERLDIELSYAARKEANRVKNQPGRPVRVTATDIAKRIGCLATTTKRKELLPLTVKTLDEVSESVEEVAIRRVKWAARCFRDEGIRPNERGIQRRAGMSCDVANRPAVRAAVNTALSSIEPSERATEIINIAA